MTIACLGDSLTEGDYGVPGKSGIANVKEKNYPYFLSQILGVKVLNFGKCGYTATSYLNFLLNEKPDFNDVDIFIIMLGTNGGLSADEATKGNCDYKRIIDYCKSQVPSSKIFLCTPPHATENNKMSNFGYAERVNNAVAFIKEYANINKLNIIDVHSCTSFCTENECIMQPNDGLHFSELGYKIMAEFISEELIHQKLSREIF